MGFTRKVLVLTTVVVLGGSVWAQQPAGRGQGADGRGQAPAGRGGGRGARGGAAAAGPWFGVALPPPFGKDPAVIVGDRKPRPATIPAGEPAEPAFAGAAIRADLEAIVNFSKESRTSKEIGSGQMWGRISGLPSGMKTATWIADQFRKAGVSDTRLQQINPAANSRLWLPLSWEVRVLGDPAFGPGTSDVVLESALPLSPSEIPSGTLTLPMVYVGDASPAVLQHIDVKGKIAVQLVVPQGHMVLERGTVSAGAAELNRRGAAGVFNLVRLPGNERARDFSNCGNPCFNIGGRDSQFLEAVLNRAAEAGMADKVRAQITLRTEQRALVPGANAVAVIRGSRLPNEAVVIDAHFDAWFDGAGDNADGAAVMLALVKHFAKPANRPQRTLVFLASAGHHTPINGVRGFIEAYPDLVKQTVLSINIEHVAQRNFSPARSTYPDGYREAMSDSGEAPAYAGINNRSPFIDNLFEQGVVRYGVNFISQKSNMGSGESGGLNGLAGPVATVIQAPPLYHTTGEVDAVISTPGLERMARFFAYFLREVDKAEKTQIGPKPAPAGGAAEP